MILLFWLELCHCCYESLNSIWRCGIPSVQNCVAVVKFFKVITIFGSWRETTTIMSLCMQTPMSKTDTTTLGAFRCYSIIVLLVLDSDMPKNC